MVEIRNKPRPNFSIAIASAKGVAERWETQYPEGRWGDEKREIGKKLIALGANAAADAVANIIGNKSWTHALCASCNEYHDEAVAFREDEVFVCHSCLRSALAALSAGEGHAK